MGLRGGDVAGAYFAARTTAIADMLFTLTAGIVQPLTGFALIHLAGCDPLGAVAGMDLRALPARACLLAAGGLAAVADARHARREAGGRADR